MALGLPQQQLVVSLYTYETGFILKKSYYKIQVNGINLVL